MQEAKANLIADIIEKDLNNMGYDLVRIVVSGQNRLKVQVMIDRLDEQPLIMDDCIKASRFISSLMDVEDPIEESYDLEVSSPGLDRPLTRPKDFQKYLLEKVKIKTDDPIDGQKRFIGILSEASEKTICIIAEDGGEPIKIAFDNIQKANVVYNFDTPENGKQKKRES